MGTTTAPDLRKLTGYWLRRAYVKADGVTQACVSEDVRLRELAALSVLAEQQRHEHLGQGGPVAQRRLGELCHISPTLTVRLVDDLEEKGWVSRERGATDRRIQALRLTDSGRAELASQLQHLDDAELQLISVLSKPEVKRLKAHLRLLLAGSPVLEASPLAEHVGYLISHAHRQVKEDVGRRMTALALHPRDFGLLAVLAQDEPCSQAHIAERLDVSPQAVLALLDALGGQYLVSRVRSQEDRRMQLVTLTEHGRRTLRKAELVADQVQTTISKQLGEQADNDLRRLLTKLSA